MRILFVCSGNSDSEIGTVVRNQAESLEKHGLQIDFFPIKGKGITGYLKNIPKLRQHLKSNNYEVVHAHYSFSGIIASLSGNKPLVVSLMGSDAYQSFFWRLLIKIFSFLRWDRIVVKTQKMKDVLGIKSAIVIPNGVDIGKFEFITRSEARNHLGIGLEKKIVIFIGDPSRVEKNFSLAEKACQYLNRKDVELMAVFNEPHSGIPYYLYSADVLLLTSLWEGSVNVVKEAMACCIPVVSTDVGDVGENLSAVTGSFICKADPGNLAEGLSRALDFTGRTNGLEVLLSLGLDSVSVAKRIISVYNDVRHI